MSRTTTACDVCGRVVYPHVHSDTAQALVEVNGMVVLVTTGAIPDPTLPERLDAAYDEWAHGANYGDLGNVMLFIEAAAALRQLEQERDEEQYGRLSAESNGVILRADNVNLTAHITELEEALRDVFIEIDHGTDLYGHFYRYKCADPLCRAHAARAALSPTSEMTE